MYEPLQFHIHLSSLYIAGAHVIHDAMIATGLRSRCVDVITLDGHCVLAAV